MKIIFTLLALYSGCVFSIECPQQPKQTSSEISVDVNASVGRLKSIGVGELKAKIYKEQKDLLGKYPNADKLYLETMFFSSYCSMLNESSISEKEKLNRIELYRGFILKDPSRSQNKIDKSKPTGGAYFNNSQSNTQAVLNNSPGAIVNQSAGVSGDVVASISKSYENNLNNLSKELLPYKDGSKALFITSQIVDKTVTNRAEAIAIVAKFAKDDFWFDFSERYSEKLPIQALKDLITLNLFGELHNPEFLKEIAAKGYMDLSLPKGLDSIKSKNEKIFLLKEIISRLHIKEEEKDLFKISVEVLSDSGEMELEKFYEKIKNEIIIGNIDELSKSFSYVKYVLLLKEANSVNDRLLVESSIKDKWMRIKLGIDTIPKSPQLISKFTVPTGLTDEKMGIYNRIVDTSALNDDDKRKLIDKLPKFNKDRINSLNSIIDEAEQKLIEVNLKYQNELKALNERHLESWKKRIE